MRLTSATHRFELEQPIEVRVSAIDLKRRAINFQLASSPDAEAASSGTPTEAE
jgi:hypothetical protein